MNVVSVKAIRTFSEKHSDSATSLMIWYQVARRAKWSNLAELRNDFPGADLVGRRTVFNIGGNKYRLIARANFAAQRVFVLGIMKHSAYEKGGWK